MPKSWASFGSSATARTVAPSARALEHEPDEREQET